MIKQIQFTNEDKINFILDNLLDENEYLNNFSIKIVTGNDIDKSMSFIKLRTYCDYSYHKFRILKIKDILKLISKELGSIFEKIIQSKIEDNPEQRIERGYFEITLNGDKFVLMNDLTFFYEANFDFINY